MCRMAVRAGVRIAAVAATVSLLGAWPAWAGAKVYAPPGKAGATEYSETIPTSGGNVRPPNPTAYTGTAKPAGPDPIANLGVGVKGLRRDAKLGPTGQQAAGFAQSTAPVVVKTTSSTRPAAAAAAAVTGSAAGSGSAAGAVMHLLGGGDGGGIGVMLPLVLAFTLGLACGVTALRVIRTERA